MQDIASLKQIFAVNIQSQNANFHSDPDLFFFFKLVTDTVLSGSCGV